MKKRLIILFIIITTLLTGCGGSEELSESEKKEKMIQDQKYMVQVKTQDVLKKYNFDIDTSPLLEDWTITNQNINNSSRWAAVTYAEKTRIKCIFEWSGKDEDDFTLLYFLIGDIELVNNL